MKNLVAATAICLIFASCGSNGGKSENGKETEQKKALVTAPAKPENITFIEQDFEGIGTIKVPSGKGWEKDGNEINNENLSMTIVIQSQIGDFTKRIKEYTDSYIEVNKTDAPKYEVTEQETGAIGGIDVVRVIGKFNSGDPYSTRDYLFYTPQKVVMCMSRANAKDQATLNQITDYIVASFKKK